MFPRPLHSAALFTTALLLAVSAHAAVADSAAPVAPGPANGAAVAAEAPGSESATPVEIAAAGSDASHTTYHRRFRKGIPEFSRDPRMQIEVDVTWTVDRKSHRITAMNVNAGGKALKPGATFLQLSRNLVKGQIGDRVRHIDVIGDFTWCDPRGGPVRSESIRMVKQIGEGANTY